MYFCREDELVAGNPESSQRFARHRFGAAGVVDVCRIDEVDAAVKGCAHDVIDRGLTQLANRPPQAFAAAEGHGSETDFRNEQAGIAELLESHGYRLSGARASARAPPPERATSKQ